ncbi:DNA-binding protein WhiA [Mycoplasma sp. E35C]|uniref:DNA-binding protein WhiA n=1 Tax=Mycoplasma sp. E35C TaxID=2801918 RepID=UPI001CA426ED|nr:DNA-binding protein WhiA [Mycoplasma sp. E35C]QZX48885.1 DNA-binding protein WhiA [Mycoplasma sp. E35C]
MLTFSQEVKNEICNQTLDKKSAKFFLNGIIFNKLTHSFDSYQSYVSQHPRTIIFLKKILILLDQELQNQIQHNRSENRLKKQDYELTFKLDQQLLNINADQLDETNMRAFFGGLFLSVGNLASPKSKNQHLELVFNEQHKALLINNLLIQNNFDQFKLTSRKNKYVLYVKKIQVILDFLAFINAFSCRFEYEDINMKRKIIKQAYSSNNLDIANLTKTINLNEKLKPMINAIIADQCFNHQTEIFKIYCYLKLDHPDASLNELSKLLQTKGYLITRTGLAHYNKKIKQLYNQIKK